MKTIDDFDLQGKKVLLRVDLNSDVKNGKIISSQRIKESAETIIELQKRNAKIVVISHQGNPSKSDFLSLRQHCKALNKYTKVSFIKDVVGKKAIKAIKNLKKSKAILLDNLRFEKDEFEPKKKDNILIKNLSPLFDLYINDAFSVSHRDNTSITSFPKYITSCAGPKLFKELKALEKITLKKTLYILGGAKPQSNIELLKGNKVLAGGLFGQICLVSKGKNLGYQNDFLKKTVLIKENYDSFLKKLRKKLSNVVTPVDFAVEKDKRRKELPIEEFPNNYEIKDIGQKTIKLFIREIKKAKSIYMKGPLGKSNDKIFSQGTFSILEAIASSKAFSVIGGGHLSDAIKSSKIKIQKFGHISLSGGALLEYIAGKKLVGLISLGYYKKNE